MTRLVPPPCRQYIIAMGEQLAKAVRKALRRLPCSDRALCQEAGIPPSTLARIRSGERGATREVTVALAAALARWRDRTADAERTLRRALQQEGDR